MKPGSIVRASDLWVRTPSNNPRAFFPDTWRQAAPAGQVFVMVLLGTEPGDLRNPLDVEGALRETGLARISQEPRAAQLCDYDGCQGTEIQPCWSCQHPFCRKHLFPDGELTDAVLCESCKTRLHPAGQP